MVEEKDLTGRAPAPAAGAMETSLRATPGAACDADGGRRRARLAPRPTPPPAWRDLPARRAVASCLGSIQHVHFVGIGGSGMSGIAEVLLNLGLHGDRLRPEALGRHRRGSAELGARVFEGPRAANVAGAQVVVTSTRGAARQPRGGGGAARAACP